MLSCYEVINQKDLYIHIFGFCLNTFHNGEKMNDVPHYYNLRHKYYIPHDDHDLNDQCARLPKE